VARPHLALLQRAAKDIAEAARRRRRRQRVKPPDDPTAAELGRRLDETRERLRRDIPPRTD
jgi:hypothetical protein